MNWVKLFATFFYSGLSPKAPGTVGTLAAIPLVLLAYTLGSEADGFGAYFIQVISAGFYFI